jgi:hypothetical protein
VAASSGGVVAVAPPVVVAVPVPVPVLGAVVARGVDPVSG